MPFPLRRRCPAADGRWAGVVSPRRACVAACAEASGAAPESPRRLQEDVPPSEYASLHAQCGLVWIRRLDAAPRQAFPHLSADDRAPTLACPHALLEDQRLDLTQVLPERALVEAHELIQLGLTEMRRVNRDEGVHELGQAAPSSREECIPEGAGDLRIGGALCRHHRLHPAQRKPGGAGQIQQMPNGGGFCRVCQSWALLREYRIRQYRRGQRQTHQATAWSGHDGCLDDDVTLDCAPVSSG